MRISIHTNVAVLRLCVLALLCLSEQFCPAQTYSDGDQKNGVFSILAGFEQSYLSSQSDQTDGFVRAFMKANVPMRKNWTFSPWGVIRDLGAPSSNSNQNLVTAITNPDGTITSSSLSSIGYSVDFLIGVGFDHAVTGDRQYSVGPIIAFGSTTPISSTTPTSGYMVPTLGTEECAELQSRFTTPSAYAAGYSKDLIAATSLKPPTCLENIAGGTSAPVTILAFSGINRSNFLEKWQVGVRTIFRTFENGATTCDLHNPCSRGVVDLSLGQDAAVTGGQMRHFVFKVDGTAPFPSSRGYLYIFGSGDLRVERNQNLPPLVLSPATSDDLKPIPSPNIFVEPYLQPNKDFYRIGVGININKLIKK